MLASHEPGHSHRLTATHNGGISQSMPNLTLKRIPNGSHWVVYEQPALINAMIKEFITNTK